MEKKAFFNNCSSICRVTIRPHFPGHALKIDANVRKLDLSILIFTLDFDYLWISILYQSLTLKKCFITNVRLCDSRRTLHLNQLTNIVKIRYLGSSANIQGLIFLISPLSLKLTIVHIRKEEEKFRFSKKWHQQF